MTETERHERQQVRPQLDRSNPGVNDCCKEPENLQLSEYRPDVVAVWKCSICNLRHFRAFMPENMMNLPVR